MRVHCTWYLEVLLVPGYLVQLGRDREGENAAVPAVAGGTTPYWLHFFFFQVRQINDTRNRWFDVGSAGTKTGVFYGLRKST